MTKEQKLIAELSARFMEAQLADGVRPVDTFHTITWCVDVARIIVAQSKIQPTEKGQPGGALRL